MKFTVPHFHYMRYSRLGLIFSLCLTSACILLMIFRGFNFGLEFTGGATMELRFANHVNISAVRQEVTQIDPDATVIQYGSAQDVQVRFAEKAGTNTDTLLQTILSGVQKTYPQVQLMSQSKIGGEYRAELVEKGLTALVLSSLAMILYLSIRFQWRFALGAVIAQLHDVIIVAGLFSLMQWTFDLNVLAALLAVLGYSVNDTVVVFDRIRENFRKMPAEKPGEVIDYSITQTMARTLVTSFTTALAVLALLVFGGETLFGFATAMLVGIVFGTYSSIFVASALAYKLGIKQEDLLPKTKKQLDELP